MWRAYVPMFHMEQIADMADTYEQRQMEARVELALSAEAYGQGYLYVFRANRTYLSKADSDRYESRFKPQEQGDASTPAS